MFGVSPSSSTSASLSASRPKTVPSPAQQRATPSARPCRHHRAVAWSGRLPTLSRLFAADRHEELHDTLCSATRGDLLSVIGGCALALAAAPIAAIVYGRGAYTLEDTLATAALPRWLALGTVAWSLQPLLVRGFFAREVMWAPMWSGRRPSWRRTSLRRATHALRHRRSRARVGPRSERPRLRARRVAPRALRPWALVSGPPRPRRRRPRGSARRRRSVVRPRRGVWSGADRALFPPLQFAVLGASFALPALGGSS